MLLNGQDAINEKIETIARAIQLVVQRWQSVSPLRWFSQNDEGVVAEGGFLEAPVCHCSRLKMTQIDGFQMASLKGY